ncbi:hypothetical protein GCM10009584_11790 [Ornithinimicrobium humiphilum]|uniref:Glycosyl transferase family 1 n=1 Tax=Ornithinimicrobium humiphilum TaxID=125288 RepID=A0A543KJM2_9MICO|nr:hypothetical protein [Ornithinimicrobium humiphilum]TQM95282.1 hypothetical protein FB476_0121 [Ornithinimicrobium humiphilum]
MTERPVSVHFWTDRDVTGVDDWNPDAAPELHPSGYGHTFLELYARLRSQGRAVSIGPRAPRATTVLLASLEELTSWLPRCEPSLVRALARSVLRTGAPLVVVRADVHPHIPAPPFTALEVRPTQAAVVDPTREAHLPLLPQRGLVPRDPGRGTRVETLVLKAYRKNVPEWVSNSFVAEVRALGMTFELHTEESGTAGWEDFRAVDVSLCSQPSDTLGDPARKPATKLVKAWRAWSIPLVVPTLPYADIGRNGVDMLTAETPEQVLAVLGRLRIDTSFATNLFRSSAEAGRRYETDAVASVWWKHLAGARPVPRRIPAASLVREYAAALRRRLPRSPAVRGA